MYPDDGFVVGEQNHRIRYPAPELFFQPGTGAEQRLVRRAVVHYLFVGSEPLVAQVSSLRSLWLDKCVIEPQEDILAHQYALAAWWEEYCRDSRELKGNAHFVRQLMQRCLARRLDLPVPTYPTQAMNERPMADLERNFERSISTLLGIDSLLLAVPDVDRGNYDDRPLLADGPLPMGMRVPAVQIPAMIGDVSLEPLVNYVPQDCFYLRCGSVADLLWLREFLTGWGGSLHEIVSLPTLQRSIRPKLEQQLALGADRSQSLGLDQTISDMALIGCDFFFQEGAAVGVLLEAKDARKLQAIIQQQRDELQRSNPAVQQKAVKVGQHAVSLLGTHDHTVRSFYVSRGRYHLVTNSSYILQQFLSIRNGHGSLGRLNEFRYARGQLSKSQPVRAFIYLSDPFFRQLASPHYRIELMRRARTMAACHELTVASLVGQSEVTGVTTVEQLTAAGYLPASFGTQGDGSRLRLVDGHAVDALRGRQGTYLPIPDVTVAKATSAEQLAYRQFASRYQQQWGRVDPLMVTITSQQGMHHDTQRVRMGIHITPFARQRYAFLSSRLAPASFEHIQSVEGDVLRVDARLKDPRGKQYLVHMGLQDGPVTFEIKNGEIRRTDVQGGTHFSQTNQYVGISPQGIDGLQLVQQFIGDLQQGMGGRQSTTARASNSSDFLLSFLVVALFPERFFETFFQFSMAEWISHRDNWTVFGRDPKIRQHVLANLRTTRSAEPAQVRLVIPDPNQARVAGYLHAFAYAESRKMSAQNAQLLNDLHSQLGLPPAASLLAAERIFEAIPVCPLGGRYEVTTSDGAEFWKSSAWNEPSCYQLENAPPDYRFPFLDWLRGAKVLFALSANTLKADVELDVHRVARRAESEAAMVREAYRVDPDAAGGGRAVRPITTPIKAGDLVEVTAEQTKLRVGRQTIARLSPGMSLMVVEVRGDWIGVWGFQRDKAVRGWIAREELMK